MTEKEQKLLEHIRKIKQRVAASLHRNRQLRLELEAQKQLLPI